MKKFTFIESQFSLRTLLARTSMRWPATSKARRSPSLSPSVDKIPDSIETSIA